MDVKISRVVEGKVRVASRKELRSGTVVKATDRSHANQISPKSKVKICHTSDKIVSLGKVIVKNLYFPTLYSKVQCTFKHFSLVKMEMSNDADPQPRPSIVA